MAAQNDYVPASNAFYGFVFVKFILLIIKSVEYKALIFFEGNDFEFH